MHPWRIGAGCGDSRQGGRVKHLSDHAMRREWAIAQMLIKINHLGLPDMPEREKAAVVMTH
jgi:hypothetical protein